MLKFDFLIIGYVDNILDLDDPSEREANTNISEDQKIMELDGVGNLDEYIRSLLE